MGVSTDGIVAFGFDLGEELPASFRTYLGSEDDDDEEYFDWDAFVEHHLGLQNEEDPARKAGREGFSVDLVTHCSYDYPMYFLAVNGTEVSARRGYPKKLDLADVTAAKIQAMREFCEQMGIEWQEPSWHLMSIWG